MHQRLIRDLWMVPQTTPLFKLQIPTPPSLLHNITSLPHCSNWKSLLPSSLLHNITPLSHCPNWKSPHPPSLLCDIMSLSHCPNWKFPHPHLSSTTSYYFPTILIGNIHAPYLSSVTPHNCPIVLIGNPCTPQLCSAHDFIALLSWLDIPVPPFMQTHTPLTLQPVADIEDTLGGQEMDWEETCKYHRLIIHELIIDGFIFKLLLNVVAHPWPLPTYSTQF